MIRCYIVRVLCPQCGRVHQISGDFRLNGGPVRPGNVAELYYERPLPDKLTNLLQQKTWCPHTAQWVEIDEWGRVYLQPRPAFGP
jgi:hypothetical protein